MSNPENQTPLDECSGDIRDCEVMRAAITLNEAYVTNERVQELRQQLAEVACQDCTLSYLGDVETGKPLSGRIRTQRAIISSEIFWYGEIQGKLPRGPHA